MKRESPFTLLKFIRNQHQYFSNDIFYYTVFDAKNIFKNVCKVLSRVKY